MKTIILLAAFILTACGSEEKDTTVKPKPKAAAPAASTNERDLFYGNAGDGSAYGYRGDTTPPAPVDPDTLPPCSAEEEGTKTYDAPNRVTSICLEGHWQVL